MNRRFIPVHAVGAAFVFVTACGGAQRPGDTAPPQPAGSNAARDHEATSAGSLDEEEAEPVPEEPAAAETQTIDAHAELSRAVTELEELLRPTELGCSGAEPHVEAICRIAERICELAPGQPSSTEDPEECPKARAQCVDAKQRYAARCE